MNERIGFISFAVQRDKATPRSAIIGDAAHKVAHINEITKPHKGIRSPQDLLIVH